MKCDPDQFRVRPGRKVDLKKWPTRIEPVYESSKDYRHLLAGQIEELGRLQKLLYASNDHALLLIFQAMDAAGKDGAIAHVLTGINPQGCEVSSFKHPSASELEHDFLWRTTQRLPGRGRIGVFNRSYYEEVLIVRVHPEILRGEGLPPAADGDGVWRKRHHSIRGLEKHLSRNGTRILKFFLHLSKDEQRRRFIDRIDDPDKNWKFSAADIEERRYWNDYMRAYEDCLSSTSSKAAPWYVVPADDKPNARLIIAHLVIAALRDLKLAYPRVSTARRRELHDIRRKLERHHA
ncbi:MAG TPA: ADP-polyphosphate phosphotransferase [Candidatus Didemnitutus sp.]|nr:ADP-polyphosphate phosphotransferase [Candidatus Didemnitutus sp.]